MKFETKKKLIQILENLGGTINEATPALIDAMFNDYEDNKVMEAALEVIKRKGCLTLGDIKQQLEPQENVKSESTQLAQRAIALLRYPQRDGQDAAEKADPQAYALLMKAGRWYDLHVRSEDPRAMRELRYELKTLAEDALKTAKAGSKTLLNGSDKQTSLPAPETSPRAQTEPKITKEELEAKIATMMFEREAIRPPSEPVKLPPDMAKYFENIENKIKERR